jgi:PmbA protein
LVDTALAMPKSLVPDAAAEASEGWRFVGQRVRKGDLETSRRNRDKSLGITVYIGKSEGNASTSDF